MPTDFVHNFLAVSSQCSFFTFAYWSGDDQMTKLSTKSCLSPPERCLFVRGIYIYLTLSCSERQQLSLKLLSF